MPTENFRIPLNIYLAMQHEDASIDMCDTEIDALICVETDVYDDPEFPWLKRCCDLLCSLIDVVQFNGETVILDISGLLHHNIDVIRPWVAENWKPGYDKLLDEDDGEWEYQFISMFGKIICGACSEGTHERYTKLLEQFHRVPAEPDTLVLVPARQVMSEAGGIA